MQTVHKDTHYLGFPLLTGYKYHQGYYEEALHTWHDILLNYTQIHSRAYIVRLDFSYPFFNRDQYPEDNQLFSKALEALCLSYRRKGADPAYCWAREKSPQGGHHYHLILLFNERKIQNSHGVLSKAKRYWASQLGIPTADGLVHLSEITSGYAYCGGLKLNVKNDDKENIKRCFELGTYLCKVHSKDPDLYHINQFGSSRLKR